MNVNDLLNVGSGILNDVTRAVESGNYDGLGERTRERVAFAATQFSSVGKRDPAGAAAQSAGPGAAGQGSAGRAGAGDQAVRTSQPTYQPYSYAQPQNRSYFLSRPQKRTAGLLQIVGGAAGAIVGAMGSLINFGSSAAVHAIGNAAGSVAFSVFGIFFAALFFLSLGVLNSGIKWKNLVKRYYEYGAAVGGAEYFSIDKLAAKVGTTAKELTKNLERMIRGNLLPGARLDRRKTTLMLTDRAYQQYQQAEQSRVEREAQAQLRGEPAVAVTDDHLDGDVRRIIEDGNRAIQHVRGINDEIPDTLVMSDKLYRLEEIMKRIFEQVKKDPGSAPDLRRFMDYYLPTTTKLLSAYVELDRQPVQGENIARTKQEIEASLDTINDAFEQLLDGMFSDMALDISTDISVMKTMMAQDGLAGQASPMPGGAGTLKFQ